MKMDQLAFDQPALTEWRGNHATIRFERHLPCPVEMLWAHLTRSDLVAAWQGQNHIEPWTGGRFERYTNRVERYRLSGRIMVWDPPHLFAASMGYGGEDETPIRYELTAEGPDASRMVFVQGKISHPWLGLVLPGWHYALERLTIRLNDEDAELPSIDRMRQLQQFYIHLYKLEGVLTDLPAGSTC